jgi:RNA polymerase-binding transcription factor DksA
MRQGYGERGSCTSRSLCHFYAGRVTDDAAMPPHVDEATDAEDRVTEVDDPATDVEDVSVTTGDSPGDGLQVATVTIEQAEGVLADVESALERLESGQYLTCEICGAPLDPAILVNAPTLRRCVVHAS